MIPDGQFVSLLDPRPVSPEAAADCTGAELGSLDRRRRTVSSRAFFADLSF